MNASSHSIFPLPYDDPQAYDDELLYTCMRMKQVFRQIALKKRDHLSEDARASAAQAIAARAFPVDVPAGAIVSGFSAIRSEIDPMPLMLALRARGARLALPVTTKRGEPLIMREWQPGVDLVPAPFGLFEPPAEASACDPDILLVPLAAFDRRGHRIGYGAGYYDRTIARLRALKPIAAIGLAFSVQETKEVPATPFDQKLDFVMTEKELIDFRGD